MKDAGAAVTDQPSVAIIYDDTVRSDTTGGYCLRALRRLAKVTHFRSSSSEPVPPGFDLYLRIDDDLEVVLPSGLHPAFLWAIDTHRNLPRLRQQARDYDLVFSAQKQGVAQLQETGIDPCEWLPLACDPDIHRRMDVERSYDVGFVGHIFSGPRQQLLEEVMRRFPRSFVGQLPHTEMAEVYSRAKIVVNCSLANDLNMRVFEALSCGALLVTDRLRDNGQEDLFRDRVHLVEYQAVEEALELIGYYLKHEEERRQIAEAGHQEALARHTYEHRMVRVLERLTALPERPRKPAAPPQPDAGREREGRSSFYYRWPRPEIMALVPRDAARVLDIGCAAGVLGQELKRRQPCEVVGVEIDPAAAREARARLDQVVEGDVEHIDLKPLGVFDAAICADVLEHLRDPVALLKKVRGVLSDTGVLIASLPNVRHIEVVQRLVEGGWTYQPEGVMDRDHLRFFTRRSAEQLLDDAGFEVAEARPVKASGYEGWQQAGRPGDIHAGRLSISGMTAEEAEEFFVGQWLFVARSAGRLDWGLTSIIILTWNQFEYTRLCLDSVRQHTHLPYELIVVDNGSTDGTVDWLRSLPDVRLITNPTNLGFPKAANQGIGAAAGDNILLLNNDTVVTPGWLLRLLTRLHSNPDIGMVGPLTNCSAGPQQIPVLYRSLMELDGYAWDLGRRHRGESSEVGMLVGFCLLAKRAVLDRIGLLDERFGLGTFEDTDLSHRAIHAGYRLAICRDAFVHHFGSRTLIGNQVPAEQLLQENLRRFAEKWSLPMPAEEPDHGHVAGVEQIARPLSGAEMKRDRSQRWRIGRHPSGGLVLDDRRPTISLCMIARDEEAHIADCLTSVRPYVDEMIVVDTGSSDRTPEIAGSLGATVIRAQWQESFSAARNASLQHATGDWIFWMDADDVLPPESGEQLRQCAQDAGDNVLGIVAQVHCPSGLGEYGETVVDHVKLFRNRPDLRFELRIHEQILPSIRRAKGEIARAPMRVIHAHYDRSPAGQKKKRERDGRLLELDLKENPDHPFVHFNAGMTALHEDDAERAVHHLRRSIELSAPAESHLRKAYALLAAAHRALSQNDAAREACQQGLVLFPDDPELLFNLGLAHQAAGRLSEAEATFQRLLAGPSAVGYLASIDTSILTFKARHNLGAVYREMGRTGEAERCWRHVIEEQPDFSPAWLALGDLLLATGAVQQTISLAERAVECGQKAIGHALRGQLALKEIDRAGAEQSFREAIAAKPDWEVGHRLLSHVLLQRGERVEAEQVLRRVLELEPGDAEAHHNLGCLLLGLGRAEEAVSQLELAVKLRPGRTISRQMLDQAVGRLESGRGRTYGQKG
jgi:GT2 family glycosyltransferase/Flp pilus assembly protein TadD/2-polyprenyl-3-methyl-5-hydroxy-6-metoxy-1,4-benzoquinol methylase